MKKYSIVPMQNDGNYFYGVYEHATEQAIDFFYFEEDAKECMKFYGNGGGFDGFTPRFVLTSVKIPLEQKDVNKRFDAAFTDDKTA